ncbi:oxidoreductase [Bradyrhizobium sp. CCBAU 51745]|uniref:NAD-dependent epimerase/dehydratase family protein n=1 Tax=Bradyrhizobium sp. CCBAU 51745 TaxID=1325099 RepID=UPI0023056B5C|nr:NAD(P)-dependent oxidoreductase [Bradyrhizobium sp. CCBAU 51745]MDA9440348.1 oxidoreductase [Bradyrhizobium sp. CCBAU 51745]
MKIVVTGSVGRLGRSVYAELKRRGHDVVGIDLQRSFGSCDREVDLRDAGEAYGAIAGIRPDAIVHLAGLPTPFGRPEHVLFATNTLTTFHVCQAAADLGVRSVLCASSPTVIGYGNPNGWAPSYLPLDEDHPAQPWHGYGISKLAIEAIVRGFAAKGGPTKYFTFRPCYVVAPEDWDPAAPTQLGHSMAERLKKPELAAGSLFNYIDARDAAALVALICQRAEDLSNGECFFASADDALATEPLCDLLPRFVPSTAPSAANLTGTRAAFSNAKANRLLGWRPLRSWRQFLEFSE